MGFKAIPSINELCINSYNTFNNNIFGGPLLLESCKQIFSSDADNMFFEIKFFRVEAEKSQP